MKRHKCEPASLITPFWHTCKECGFEIEPVDCPKCKGTGAAHFPYDECKACKGTGVKKWNKVTL